MVMLHMGEFRGVIGGLGEAFEREYNSLRRLLINSRLLPPDTHVHTHLDFNKPPRTQTAILSFPQAF